MSWSYSLHSHGTLNTLLKCGVGLCSGSCITLRVLSSVWGVGMQSGEQTRHRWRSVVGGSGSRVWGSGLMGFWDSPYMP